MCHRHSDPVTISCTVRLSGNWSPSLLISRVHPRTVHAALSPVSEDSDEPVNVTRTLGYHVSITVSPKADYMSELVFQEYRRPTAASATNVPSVKCTWNSPHAPTSRNLSKLCSFSSLPSLCSSFKRRCVKPVFLVFYHLLEFSQVFSERELKFMFAICHRPYVSRLSVCRLSVTFVRPTQAIEIFGNVSTPFGTLAICWTFR